MIHLLSSSKEYAVRPSPGKGEIHSILRRCHSRCAEGHFKDSKGDQEAVEKPMKDYGLVKNIAGQCPDCGSILV